MCRILKSIHLPPFSRAINISFYMYNFYTSRHLLDWLIYLFIHIIQIYAIIYLSNWYICVIYMYVKLIYLPSFTGASCRVQALCQRSDSPGEGFLIIFQWWLFCYFESNPAWKERSCYGTNLDLNDIWGIVLEKFMHTTMNWCDLYFSNNEINRNNFLVNKFSWPSLVISHIIGNISHHW